MSLPSWGFFITSLFYGTFLLLWILEHLSGAIPFSKSSFIFGSFFGFGFISYGLLIKLTNKKDYLAKIISLIILFQNTFIVIFYSLFGLRDILRWFLVKNHFCFSLRK